MFSARLGKLSFPITIGLQPFLLIESLSDYRFFLLLTMVNNKNIYVLQF